MAKKIKNAVYIKTFGCSLNKADSLTMENILKKSGYVIVDSPNSSNVAIINSCTVKNSAEHKMFSEINILKKNKVKHIILAGCVPQAEKDMLKFSDYNVIGVDNINDISFIVDSAIRGEIVHELDKTNLDTLEYEKRFNDAIEIVPISKGCLGSCTYCKTKQARGNLFSFDKTKIVNSINRALIKGAKEIWLTSQDCGAYGLDKGENLIVLLKYVLSNTPSGYKIRLGMSNPNHIVKFLPELKDIFEDERMFKFLHIPVQSGSDRILELMGRKYKSKDFEKICKFFSSKFSEFTIATDIIVGFPTESEIDFKRSCDLIENYRIPVLNYSRFWPRPDTSAAKMEQLKVDSVRKRTAILKEIHERITRDILKTYKGSYFRVIIDDNEEGTFVGRTDSYKKVIFLEEENKSLVISRFENVKIIKTQQWDLVVKKVD